MESKLHNPLVNLDKFEIFFIQSVPANIEHDF